MCSASAIAAWAWGDNRATSARVSSIQRGVLRHGLAKMTLSTARGVRVTSHSMISVEPHECPRMCTGPGVNVSDDIEFFDEPFQRPQSRIPWAVRSAAIELIPDDHRTGVTQCRERLKVAAREPRSAMDDEERDAAADAKTAPENPTSRHGNLSLAADVHDALGQSRRCLHGFKAQPQFERR